MTPAADRRLLLRAEVTWAGRTTVTHTLGISETAAFVPLEELPPVGVRLLLRLSFPRLVEALHLWGVVVEQRGSSGPGDPAGVTVEFEFATEDQRSRLLALLRQTAGPGDAAPARPPTQPYRVLLVDDNSMIRDMFAYGVRKYFRARHCGVQLDLAPDGAEALRLLLAGDYDLAIVDYYLPVLGGRQLIARVRQEARLAGLPVVAISVGGAEARDASLEAGADLFLHKPLVLRDLFATLEWLTAGGGTR